MTKVEFYFDPGCPWCWVTSRWLLLVNEHREMEVTWRPFSLAMKNGSLEKEEDSPYAAVHRASHRVLRVMMAAHKHHKLPLIDSYTLFGIKHHVAGFDYDKEWTINTVNELGLPKEISEAADDTSYDELLAAELQSAVDVVGEDVGVPTIVFTTPGGEKQGYFGPVIREVPELDEALRLWDGLANLATVSSFYELKRSRPSGGPNTSSNANC